ncbi:hypothetical protein QJS04_geneDACA023873 [Acorus gramineus]|uniref:Uncharacterized protein n=1 Tax=Acorus gramineus TaxID=55184 RepID=A0AAV9BN38_ACOGR|nr:hypothetical protein QJS04_geneDACA023873 [Acorus gramineus]
MGKNKVPKERVAEPRRNKAYYPQYRSAIHRIFETFATMKLNKKHLDLLQRTPFWNLFKSFIDKSYDYSKTKKNDDT